ncbi:corrinoid ABC transporter substrate-binding protein [uncultured Roseburia sp.]|uniref:ABC transporter substrate-binding protein n=1 Tax=Brotonthovivens ammoniilytica TaxID=2981725 RepID=A0ABT2THB2_9FIRM|nr:ABC transporter substrate-binding protein [Brotonthovivens ammoniilytica]MCU6761526.1 ABC transporter substrate-binding protein [Brotonthovivens ammoniilytica]SCI30990.1 corrinoid ABC transporter substrate-binding protein [uncultured Roseburia sp.]
MKKFMIVLAAGVMSLVCLGLMGCGRQQLEYEINVSGSVTEPGVIEFLDFNINVYKDLASNSCGTCADQPVHLYVGADAQETAQAIEDVVTRADDLWEVVSNDGETVLLREKTPGSVESIKGITGPAGLTMSGTAKGREVPVLSGNSQSTESGTVDFPENPQRLAAVYGPSYELLTMLGAEDKIVVRADVQTADFPWAEKVFKRIKDVPMLVNVHTSVNFEELMNYNPDIVYTFPRENELNQLNQAGVAALSGQSGETLEDLKKQVRAYGDTLGDEAVVRAEKYCSYFDQKLAFIKERTDQIPEEEKPKVYYAGVDVLTTYGKYSDIMEVIEAAGGVPVSKELEAGNRSQINYEQLMSWNPDVIFLDHGGMNDGETVEELKAEISGKSTYKTLNAVKNGQIYMSPSGVFYWDMGLQKILLVMNMAKILHPDLFKDLDMESEVMAFYEKFYDYPLTREEASLILNRESPKE